MPNSVPVTAPVYRVRVAVPVHLFDCFDYSLSQEQYQQAEVGAESRFLLAGKIWSA